MIIYKGIVRNNVRLKVMATDCSPQLTFWDLGKQQVTVDFHGGQIVTDAGLLALRELDKRLRILSELAQRLHGQRGPLRVKAKLGAYPLAHGILRQKN